MCRSINSYDVVDIIADWRPGIQADSHEMLMGILNRGPANVNSLIQFDMLTKGIASETIRSCK